MQLKRVAEAKLPTPWGDFLMVGFEELATGQDHVALVYGDISGQTPVLSRVHSECLTGDALFSLRCDCGFQLEAALSHIAEEGRGVLLYHRQEGRKASFPLASPGVSAPICVQSTPFHPAPR